MEEHADSDSDSICKGCSRLWLEDVVAVSLEVAVFVFEEEALIVVVDVDVDVDVDADADDAVVALWSQLKKELK